MAISITQGFDIRSNEPVDSRFIVADETARLAIPSATSYDGLIVYQEDDETLWVLNDSSDPSSASSWHEVTAADANVNALANIQVSGQSTISAGAHASTVEFVGGDFVTIETDNGSDPDSVTWNADVQRPSMVYRVADWYICEARFDDFDNASVTASTDPTSESGTIILNAATGSTFPSGSLTDGDVALIYTTLGSTGLDDDRWYSGVVDVNDDNDVITISEIRDAASGLQTSALTATTITNADASNLKIFHSIEVNIDDANHQYTLSSQDNDANSVNIRLRDNVDNANDDNVRITAGNGLSVSQSSDNITLDAEYATTGDALGTATTVARSDHGHASKTFANLAASSDVTVRPGEFLVVTDTGATNIFTAGVYFNQTTEDRTLTATTSSTDFGTWFRILDADDDTTYSAGSGLDLNGTVFSLDILTGGGLQTTPAGNAGELGIDLDTNSGLQLGADGISVDLDGVSLQTGADGLSVNLGTDSGLEVSTDGLEVNVDGNSLQKGSSGLSVNLADSNPGLEVTSTGVQIDLDTDSGLELVSGGLRVDVDGQSLSRAAAGLSVNLGTDSGLEVSTDGLEVDIDGDSLSKGTDGLSVNLAASSGLEVQSDGIRVDVSGNSLTRDASGLSVNLADTNPGLEVVSSGLQVDLATDSGLQRASTGLEVDINGDSLTKDSDGLSVNVYSDGGLESTTNGLEVELPTNSGLSKGANGLSVEFGPGQNQVARGNHTHYKTYSQAFDAANVVVRPGEIVRIPDAPTLRRNGGVLPTGWYYNHTNSDFTITLAQPTPTNWQDNLRRLTLLNENVSDGELLRFSGSTGEVEGISVSDIQDHIDVPDRIVRDPATGSTIQLAEGPNNDDLLGNALDIDPIINDNTHVTTVSRTTPPWDADEEYFNNDKVVNDGRLWVASGIPDTPQGDPGSISGTDNEPGSVASGTTDRWTDLTGSAFTRVTVGSTNIDASTKTSDFTIEGGDGINVTATGSTVTIEETGLVHYDDVENGQLYVRQGNGARGLNVTDEIDEFHGSDIPSTAAVLQYNSILSDTLSRQVTRLDEGVHRSTGLTQFQYINPPGWPSSFGGGHPTGANTYFNSSRLLGAYRFRQTNIDAVYDGIGTTYNRLLLFPDNASNFDTSTGAVQRFTRFELPDVTWQYGDAAFGVRSAIDKLSNANWQESGNVGTLPDTLTESEKMALYLHSVNNYFWRNGDNDHTDDFIQDWANNVTYRAGSVVRDASETSRNVSTGTRRFVGTGSLNRESRWVYRLRTDYSGTLRGGTAPGLNHSDWVIIGITYVDEGFEYFSFFDEQTISTNNSGGTATPTNLQLLSGNSSSAAGFSMLVENYKNDRTEEGRSVRRLLVVCEQRNEGGEWENFYEFNTGISHVPNDVRYRIVGNHPIDKDHLFDVSAGDNMYTAILPTKVYGGLANDTDWRYGTSPNQTILEETTADTFILGSYGPNEDTTVYGEIDVQTPTMDNRRYSVVRIEGTLHSTDNTFSVTIHDSAGSGFDGLTGEISDYDSDANTATLTLDTDPGSNLASTANTFLEFVGGEAGEVKTLITEHGAHVTFEDLDGNTYSGDTTNAEVIPLGGSYRVKYTITRPDFLTATDYIETDNKIHIRIQDDTVTELFVTNLLSANIGNEKSYDDNTEDRFNFAEDGIHRTWLGDNPADNNILATGSGSKADWVGLGNGIQFSGTGASRTIALDYGNGPNQVLAGNTEIPNTPDLAANTGTEDLEYVLRAPANSGALTWVAESQTDVPNHPDRDADDDIQYVLNVPTDSTEAVSWEQLDIEADYVTFDNGSAETQPVRIGDIVRVTQTAATLRTDPLTAGVFIRTSGNADLNSAFTQTNFDSQFIKIDFDGAYSSLSGRPTIEDPALTVNSGSVTVSADITGADLAAREASIRTAIGAASATVLSNHTSATNNPHNVNAEQVGVRTTALSATAGPSITDGTNTVLQPTFQDDDSGNTLRGLSSISWEDSNRTLRFSDGTNTRDFTTPDTSDFITASSADTLTNKSIDAGQLTGTIGDSLIPDSITRDTEIADFITASSADTLTNKTIDASQLTGTIGISLIPSGIARDSELPPAYINDAPATIGTSGQVLKVNSAGDGLEFAADNNSGGGGGEIADDATAVRAAIFRGRNDRRAVPRSNTFVRDVESSNITVSGTGDNVTWNLAGIPSTDLTETNFPASSSLTEPDVFWGVNVTSSSNTAAVPLGLYHAYASDSPNNIIESTNEIRLVGAQPIDGTEYESPTAASSSCDYQIIRLTEIDEASGGSTVNVGGSEVTDANFVDSGEVTFTAATNGDISATVNDNTIDGNELNVDYTSVSSGAPQFLRVSDTGALSLTSTTSTGISSLSIDTDEDGTAGTLTSSDGSFGIAGDGIVQTEVTGTDVVVSLNTSSFSSGDILSVDASGNIVAGAATTVESTENTFVLGGRAKRRNVDSGTTYVTSYIITDGGGSDLDIEVVTNSRARGSNTIQERRIGFNGVSFNQAILNVGFFHGLRTDTSIAASEISQIAYIRGEVGYNNTGTAYTDTSVTPRPNADGDLELQGFNEALRLSAGLVRFRVTATVGDFAANTDYTASMTRVSQTMTLTNIRDANGDSVTHGVTSSSPSRTFTVQNIAVENEGYFGAIQGTAPYTYTNK